MHTKNDCEPSDIRLIKHLAPDAKNSCQILHHGWNVYSHHKNPWVRATLARRSDCPTEVLADMWEQEYMLYAEKKRKDILMDTIVMSCVACNKNTPPHCLAQALHCEEPAIHLMACGNPHTPLDTILLQINSYRWSALLALAYHPKATHEILIYISKIPPDNYNGLDFNTDLRTLARQRVYKATGRMQETFEDDIT
jgi:hypothetical protein